ncbi:hypothetical protein RRG08_032176 [Elysia crispata]|uniref:Uncharacterized protein n=1 Tax=Elysia crispata TaxID=231223 RepID=A0AAE1DX34_9GAST|nr:hypothetical protein RRG08_032176 [Elysia crispata]
MELPIKCVETRRIERVCVPRCTMDGFPLILCLRHTEVNQRSIETASEKIIGVRWCKPRVLLDVQSPITVGV